MLLTVKENIQTISRLNQIFNVGTMQEGLVDRKEEKEGEKEDQGPAIPRYNLKVKTEVLSGPSHQYNLHP